MKLTNFLIFWMLVTHAISRGDMAGVVIYAAGFLVMHTMIEEYYEAN
jgi:hypothetical protein